MCTKGILRPATPLAARTGTPNIQVQKSSLPDEAEAGEGRAKRCWRASGGQLPAACDQRRLNQTRWPSI